MALASKATGFPIAKIAAKLAVGYTLNEIPNDITKKTPACFEPTIDYCVVKIPRFTFEKFPGASDTLGTAMKSVGETMAIGRTFKEALNKGLRSLEVKSFGLDDTYRARNGELTREQITDKLKRPNAERVFYIKYALEAGFTIDEIYALTYIDRWFLVNMQEIVEFEKGFKEFKGKEISAEKMLEAKKLGFSDVNIAKLLGSDEISIFNLRKKLDVQPVFKLVDTCSAEFEAFTPYYYSTYEVEDESRV